MVDEPTKMMMKSSPILVSIPIPWVFDATERYFNFITAYDASIELIKNSTVINIKTSDQNNLHASQTLSLILVAILE